MFKFLKRNKKDQESSPKKKIWDKVLMGAIIGGAIGSVIGASIAPKKGKETRKDLAKMAQKAKKSSRIFFHRFKKMLKIGRSDSQDKSVKKIPRE